MSEPPGGGVAAPDWQHWQVVTSGLWPAPQETEAAIRWRSEVVVGVLIATYSALFGGLVGLVWPRVAPHIRLAAAIYGSEAATKALLGDDMWLALLGILAGVVTLAVALLIAPDATSGPGAVLGLAVGGVLGSLVAAQVGHLVQHPHVLADLRVAYPGITRQSTATILGYFDFRVRAKAVLVAWPLAAVIGHTLVTILRQYSPAWPGRPGRG